MRKSVSLIHGVILALAVSICIGADTERIRADEAQNKTATARDKQVRDARRKAMRHLAESFQVVCKTEDGDQPIPIRAHLSRNEVVGEAKVGVGKSCQGLRYTVGDNSGQEIMSGDIYTEQVHYLVSGTGVHQFTARRTAKHGDL